MIKDRYLPITQWTRQSQNMLGGYVHLAKTSRCTKQNMTTFTENNTNPTQNILYNTLSLRTIGTIPAEYEASAASRRLVADEWFTDKYQRSFLELFCVLVFGK